jgi:predicted nucleic acid-binding protein
MLVLDANVLMRAVPGKRARALPAEYGERVEFVTPESAVDEARRHLPKVIERRKLPPEPFMTHLASLTTIAHQRLAPRDEDDWPVLAAALALDGPIWTEDTDFFRCGVASWATDRVDLCLVEAASVILKL